MNGLRYALCNEVIADRPFDRQCALAASLGYDGVELAPFTLSDEPHLLSDAAITGLRAAAAAEGIAVVGLHWLLVRPAGLSITTADPAVRRRTLDVLRRLVALCAGLDGGVVVHGSPAQRRLPSGDEDEARRRAADLLAQAAEAAQAAGVTYCLEPLAPPAANYVTTIAEAMSIVQAIGCPALRTMLDSCAAGNGEAEPPDALLRRWMPTGSMAHVHLNDPNGRAPGQGGLRFAPLLAELRRQGYAGWASVEPFEYVPDGAGCAARGIGYLRGLEEAASER